MVNKKITGSIIMALIFISVGILTFESLKDNETNLQATDEEFDELIKSSNEMMKKGMEFGNDIMNYSFYDVDGEFKSDHIILFEQIVKNQERVIENQEKII